MRTPSRQSCCSLTLCTIERLRAVVFSLSLSLPFNRKEGGRPEGILLRPGYCSLPHAINKSRAEKKKKKKKKREMAIQTACHDKRTTLFFCSMNSLAAERNDH